MTSMRNRRIYLTARQHAALVRRVYDITGGRGTYDEIASDLMDTGVLPIWTVGGPSQRRRPLDADAFKRLFDSLGAKTRVAA